MTVDTQKAYGVHAGKIASASPPGRFLGPYMVGLAFLAKNCAIGLNLGIYGTLVASIGLQYGTSRALAGAGLSTIMFASGLTSPVVGWLIRRYSLRPIMMTGALMIAIGYTLLAYAPNIYVFLAICAFPIGSGVALVGMIPSSNLICNWYVAGRGRALGIGNMPIFIFLLPMLAAFLLSNFDLRTTLIVIGGIFAGLFAILSGVVTRPKGSLRDSPDTMASDAHQAPEGATLTGRQMLAMPSFYMMTVAIAVVGCEGLIFVTHMVPLVVDRGIPLRSASTMVSAYGFCAVGGALLFGWMSDRIGGRLTLLAQIASQILPWLTLIFVGNNYIALLCLSGIIGISSGATATLFGAVASSWFGVRNMGLAMGLSYFLQTPFVFFAVPLVGHVYDVTGSYDLAIAIMIGVFIAMAMALFFFRPDRHPSGSAKAI